MTNKLKSKSQKGGSKDAVKGKIQQKGGNIGGNIEESSNENSFFTSKALHIIIIILLVVLLISLYAKWYSSSYSIYDEDINENEIPTPTLFTRPYYYFADFIYPGYYDSYYNRYYGNSYYNDNRPIYYGGSRGGEGHREGRERGGRGGEGSGGHDRGGRGDGGSSGGHSERGDGGHREGMNSGYYNNYPPPPPTPRQYIVSKEQERLINPLLPPERSYVLTNAGVPANIDIPSRGYSGGFQQMGLLYKKDASETSNSETNILPLFGRPTHTNSNKWNYYTSSDKFHSLKIPIKHKGRDCNDEHGCPELFDDDTITVPPYNGEFKVKIYGYDSPKYLPMAW